MNPGFSGLPNEITLPGRKVNRLERKETIWRGLRRGSRATLEGVVSGLQKGDAEGDLAASDIPDVTRMWSMDEELIEKARRLGGDKEADRLERLINELDEVEQNLQEKAEEIDELRSDLVEETNLTEEAVNGMSLNALEEVAEEFGLRSRTNVKINVAGNPDKVPESPDVVVNRSQPDTFEREVPVTPVAGRVNLDDPEMRTFEYEETGPTIEAINQYKNWLAEARSEATKEREETRQEQDDGYIPTGVVNLDDVEIDEDSDIPVAGQVETEDDE